MRRIELAAIACLGLAACTPYDDEARYVTGGDVQRGRVAIRQYGCQTCHVVPGVTGADALVGPPLNGIADRLYLAGILPNTPQSMIQWLRHPQDIDSLSAMPDHAAGGSLRCSRVRWHGRPALHSPTP